MVKRRKRNRGTNLYSKYKSNNISEVAKARIERKHNKKLISDRHEDNDPILFGSDSEDRESEEEKPTQEDLDHLLAPYTKEQLISFLADSAADDPSLISHIRSVADHNVAHCKVFVRGFGWDVTTETLLKTFGPYGPIADCHVATHKTTGRNKGYGFVIFATRDGAMKALKKPEKKIGFRLSNCKLAVVGSSTSSTSNSSADIAQRKIFVGNVRPDTCPEKLKAFFATFGEIERGPFGFDLLTGKSRGFATFVYKTQEGAIRALQEAHKMFEGNQLHCKLAFDHSQKGNFSANPVAPQSLPKPNHQPAPNAAAVPQNSAMASHNPAYSMLLVQNPFITNATLNPNAMVALNPAALATLNSTANFVVPQGQAYGTLAFGAQGYGGAGVGLGSSTVLDAYRTQQRTGLSYGGSQFGQPSSVTPATGFYGGFPR